MCRPVFGIRTAITTARTRLLSVLAISSVLALAGCGVEGIEAPESSPVSTVTMTETVTATSVVTQTVTPSIETSPEALVTENPEPPSETEEGPTILQPGTVQDRFLGLNDVFSESGDWTEQRLSVASEVDVRAMATEVRRCASSDAPGLEFRLANGFKKFSLSIGQANNSKSSDRTMKIEILGNEEQLDIRSVPFNSILDLSIDVPNVNALKIVIYLEEKPAGYCNGTVTAMLYKLQLS